MIVSTRHMEAETLATSTWRHEYNRINMVTYRGLALPHFTVLLQVQLQRVHVLVKPQSTHGPQQVVTVDGLPLFMLALVACCGVITHRTCHTKSDARAEGTVFPFMSWAHLRW